MAMTVDELLAEVTRKLNESGDAFAKKADEALKAAKQSGDLSASMKDSVDKLALEHNTLMAAQEELRGVIDNAEKLIDDFKANGGRGPAPQNAAKMFVDDESVKAFAASVQGNRRVSVPVPRAAMTSPTITGPSVPGPEQRPGILPLLRPRLFVRDLISGGRTTAPAIFWVQVTGFTNNAAPVAENTTKPYSNLTYSSKITAVSTIAHMFKASKQILDDMSQLQSLIESEMTIGLKQVEEAQILTGDGTGVNLKGILPQASAYEAPITLPAAATAIDTLRLAMLQSQLARLPATGHVLHYSDWAGIELAKDTLGRYIIGDPQGSAAPRLWGLPVVATESSALLGKFLTGAFKAGAQIFDREEANILISTENADDFEKNMISIRCEERLALAVYRPEAFVFGSFSADDDDTSET